MRRICGDALRRATQVGKRHVARSAPVDVVRAVVRLPEGALSGFGGEFGNWLGFSRHSAPPVIPTSFPIRENAGSENHGEGVVIGAAGAGGNTVIRPSDKITHPASRFTTQVSN